MNKLKLLEAYIRRTFYFIAQRILFSKKNKDPKEVKKILIVRLKHIGDLFISLSTIFCLKEKFPEAKITLVTGIWNKSLVEFQNQLFDNVYYYNLNENCRNKSQRFSLRKKRGILKILKKENYDLCADFDGSWGFLFLYIFSKIRYLSSVGYLRFNQNLEQLRIKKNESKYDINRSYEGDNIFEVIKEFSVSDIREKFSLKVNSEIKNKVDNLFIEIGKEKKIIGIHPVASIKEKMWTTEGFARLCDYLISDKKFTIIFFGAKEDNAYIQEIVDKMSHKENIYIQTSLNIGEFITAVSCCDYFICLDSLAQHIVLYFNLPSLIIYMSENSVRWSKAADNIKTVLLKNKTDYDIIFKSLADFN